MLFASSFVATAMMIVSIYHSFGQRLLYEDRILRLRIDMVPIWEEDEFF